MTIIGPGLTLVGDPTFNSSVLAIALHSSSPPTCDGLNITATELGFPVLYVHIIGYSHSEMTAFNSMRNISSNFLAGIYEPWIEPQYIMYLDCFDNYLAMPPETILERMAEFDTDLLIGSEENCWPDPTQVWSGQHHQAGQYLELFESAPHIRTPACAIPEFRFANLGGIIGTPQRIFEMADWVISHYPDGVCTPSEPWPNDQACLHHYVLEGLDRTGSVPHLDCGHIFFPMWAIWADNVYPYVHLEKRSRAWPAVFHTNGHVSKPINEELKKCLSQNTEDFIVFPLVLERATLEEGGPVARQVLIPLCEHLKSLVIRQGRRPASAGDALQVEYDSRKFELL